jgi:serine protease Do
MVKFAIVILVGLSCWMRISAQVSSPSSPPVKSASRSAVRPGPVVVENGPSAPQIVTILHRLTGLKMFRLLLRSGDLGTVAKLDNAFNLSGKVHTNVIAGLALDDGQTIAAWLPEAAAETGFPALTATKPASSEVALPPVLNTPGVIDSFSVQDRELSGTPRNVAPADITVISRDGKRLIARYVGLDGVTGLSVLKVSENLLRQTLAVKERAIDIGQRVRLFGPEPATEPEAATSSAIVYVRMGEVEARVATVTRSPSGSFARVRIRSPKLSASNAGSIAVNDAGETIGIVDSVEGSEATILPLESIRSAARRVLERQSSVPRPWVGIRGEPIRALALDQILRGGWQAKRATSLFEEHRGILLTSVVPGSPAAQAALRPGDVILRVNEGEIRNAEDFSWFLGEAGPGSSVRFTIARPDTLNSEAVEVKLSESPDPSFGFGPFKWAPAQWQPSGSLAANGIETVALKPGVASRFGAKGGLLVVYVQPSTAAFNAGLRPEDVIEAVDGEQISSVSGPLKLLTTSGSGQAHSFSIVRNKEKLVLTFVVSPE